MYGHWDLVSYEASSVECAGSLADSYTSSKEDWSTSFMAAAEEWVVIGNCIDSMMVLGAVVIYL